MGPNNFDTPNNFKTEIFFSVLDISNSYGYISNSTWKVRCDCDFVKDLVLLHLCPPFFAFSFSTTGFVRIEPEETRKGPAAEKRRSWLITSWSTQKRFCCTYFFLYCSDYRNNDHRCVLTWSGPFTKQFFFLYLTLYFLNMCRQYLDVIIRIIVLKRRTALHRLFVFTLYYFIYFIIQVIL